MVRLCIGPRPIQENCFHDARVCRARFIREKLVFGGLEKSTFSGITFSIVDMVESGQNKVYRASGARNIGTKFAGIEAL